jgi:hypothetical protein
MFDYDEIDDTVYDKWGYETYDDTVVVTEDRDISKNLTSVDKLIESFALDDVFFAQQEGKRKSEGEKLFGKVVYGDPKHVVFKSKLVEKFFKHFLAIRDYKSRGLLRVRTFSPNITAYIQWMDDVEQSIDTFEKVNALYGVDHNPDYRNLENRVYQCFEKLSDKINDPRFKKLKLKINKSCYKNYKSMLSYIDRVFEKCSRLLLVRVDLSYKAEYSTSAQKPNAESNEISAEFEQVKSDIERLLNNRRHNKIFKDLIGYIWKLEYGVLRGYHYHVIFFFDNAKRSQDIVIGKSIGEYWQNVITQGRGTYYNVNGSNLHYSNDVRGVVHHADTRARKGIEDIAKYFSKADYFMRLELPKQYQIGRKSLYRTMGKGQIKIAPGSKRGRPRTIKATE